MSLDRFQEIPQDGAFTDLVWSDPDCDKTGFTISPRLQNIRNFLLKNCFISKILKFLYIQKNHLKIFKVLCKKKNKKREKIIKLIYLFYRGAGFLFGEDVFEKFLYLNDFTHIIRAHQLCHEGFLVSFKERLITVWSAPNYCYRFGKKMI